MKTPLLWMVSSISWLGIGLFKVTHVFREANRCADWLAGFAFTQTLGIHFFDHHPMGLGSLLLADICGVSWPRACMV